MRVLAIDTTTTIGSLALVEGERTVAEVRLEAPDGLGEILFGEIEAVLQGAGWSLGDIDLFAAASGPGSFTGVRVGLTTAKGLAEATGKPAAGVSNLKALASFGQAALRGPVIDARRGAIYGAVYDASLALVQDEVVMPLAEWQAQLPPGVEIIDGTFALAAAIGRIAQQQGGVDPAAIDANYVRRSDAEMAWKES
jgi:tRNA threonylcarbamoyladenosine biosynthesis protein TsaB